MLDVLTGFFIFGATAGTILFAQYSITAYAYQGMGWKGALDNLKCEAAPQILFCYGFALGIASFCAVLPS